MEISPINSQDPLLERMEACQFISLAFQNTNDLKSSLFTEILEHLVELIFSLFDYNKLFGKGEFMEIDFFRLKLELSLSAVHEEMLQESREIFLGLNSRIEESEELGIFTPVNEDYLQFQLNSLYKAKALLPSMNSLFPSDNLQKRFNSIKSTLQEESSERQSFHYQFLDHLEQMEGRLQEQIKEESRIQVKRTEELFGLLEKTCMEVSSFVKENM